MTTVQAGNKITRLQAETGHVVSMQAEISKDVFLMAAKGRALANSVKVIMYGWLYNWYAVNKHITEDDDNYNIAPEGWRAAGDAHWMTLISHIEAEVAASNLPNVGVGNILKAKRQVNHPDGGDYDTSEHPRWVANSNYGRDSAGFAAVPGGLRQSWGFGAIGGAAWFWTAGGAKVYYLQGNQSSIIGDIYYDLFAGLSVRCIRDNSSGWVEGETVTDIDGNVYNTVKIGDQIWMVQNLATTRYRNGEAIQKIEGSTAWANDTNGARCAYNNDESLVFHFKEWL